MNVSGFGRNTVGFLYDLYTALLVLYVFIGILKMIGATHMAYEVVALIIIVIYPFLSSREIVPGIGRWALGLHRFKYRDIEEYEGTGTLVTHEPLEKSEYTKRTIISVVIFISLYLLASYIRGLS